MIHQVYESIKYNYEKTCRENISVKLTSLTAGVPSVCRSMPQVAPSNFLGGAHFYGVLSFELIVKRYMEWS